MRWATLILVAAGCNPDASPDSGTQIGEEGDEATCEWVATTAPLSFDMADFVAATEVDLNEVFVFENGDTANMTLVVVATSTPTAATSEPIGGADPALCEGERYQVEVAADWTVEGYFDESLTATAWATLPGRSMWDAYIDLEQMNGPTQPAVIDPAAWQTVELIVTGEMRDGVPEGFATWSATSPGDSGQGEMVGSWGPYAGY